jgi:hypothetical protein
MRRFAQVLVPVAGLAALFLPAGGTAPTGTQCVGGLCDVCPAVAKVVAVTGEQIYCIA